jgi:pimeloyl-ACP methyl ester carboxylesterase
MRRELHALTGQPVSIVPTRSLEWVASVSFSGVARLLDKLHRTVRHAVAGSPTGKITLVGHSAGGVFSRLYLSPEPFAGRSYAGLQHVDRLITLGSPHHSQGGTTRGGRISRYADQHLPGAYFAGQVAYTTVAGKWLRGSLLTTRQARRAYSVYEQIGGRGDVWGDGLIPVPSALLDGAQQVILDDVSHFSVFGEPWYGSPETIPLWWE